MAKIAVNVVLLPSEEMADAAIEANRELLKQCPDRIVMDRQNCLPHVSLAMGCIDEGDVADIEKVLRRVAGQFPPGRLGFIGVHVGTNSAGEKVSVVGVERTRRLQSLHEEIMRVMTSYFSYDVTADMVLSPPPAGESTLLWIRNYRENSSFERFLPHITIGYGQIGDFAFPPRFTVSKLAICHLGNHCTCRKVLASVEFGISRKSG
ncbi:MAG: 2'-5' RNA ligase family protein [Planctomycetota bacterium]